MELRERNLDIIFIAVRADDITVASQLIADVSDLALQYDAVIEHQISSLTVCTYGGFEFEQSPDKNVASLIQTIRERFKNKVKILHCRGNAHHGIVGSPHRLTLTFIFPGFLEALESLSKMNFGEVREIKLNA